MDLIQPMEPVVSSKVIDKEGWIHQIKWDGIRGLTYIKNGEIRVFTKRGKERTDYYPELKELSKLFKGKEGVIDGEIIIFDQDGKPSFHNSLTRETVRTKSKVNYYSKMLPANYIIFDILRLNGEDLRRKILEERKEILKNNIEKSSIITITDDFKKGEELFDLMKTKGWEGIVSKKLDSLYIGGKKHRDWYKTKISKKILTVIGGIQWKDDSPNSLILGIYKDGSLFYVGNASGGLTQRDFRLLKTYSEDLKQEQNPFIDIMDQKNITWIKPILTCWVTFLEWTNSGHLRHPQIIGFSKENPLSADGKELVE